MKKSKIFGKRQVLFAVLVLALAAAVWLNMKYSAENGGFNISGADTSSAVLGETQYVNGELKEETVQTAATNGYFKTARSDRTKAREDAVEMLKETMGDVKIDAAAKQSAIESLAVIAKRIENEAAIESLVKAKGFSDAVVIIGDQGVNVIIQKEELLSSETLQIQDIVITQAGVDLEKIKIVSVK